MFKKKAVSDMFVVILFFATSLLSLKLFRGQNWSKWTNLILCVTPTSLLGDRQKQLFMF